MKILLDRNNALSAIDTAQEDIQIPKNAQITQTTIDVFHRYGVPVEAREIEDPAAAIEAYTTIREKLLRENALELQATADPRFIAELRSQPRPFTGAAVQKVTYKIEETEDYDKIAEELKTIESGALFRAIEFDKQNRTITEYTTRAGVWKVGDEFYLKMIEGRGGRNVRTQVSPRQVKNPLAPAEADRINFPIFEDVSTLFKKELIEKFVPAVEKEDGSYKDGHKVGKYHFAKELTEEDLQALKIKSAAEKSVKAEKSHKNKPQPSAEAVKATLKENEKEIHTVHEVVIDAPQEAEIVEEKIDTIQAYAERLKRELEEKHKQEEEALKIKIEEALGDEREKAKKTLLISLGNGMTIPEAIDNLRAAKHNDILIQTVLEELKVDLLKSIEKDKIIDTKKAELERLTKELDKQIRALEDAERKAAHFEEQMHREREVKKEKIEALVKANETIKNQNAALQKLHTTLTKVTEKARVQKVEIEDLNTTIKEREGEIEEQTKELEEQFAQIQKLEKALKEKEKAEAAAAAKIAELEKAIEAQAIETDKQRFAVEKLKKEISGKEKEVTKLNGTIAIQQNDLKSKDTKLEEVGAELKTEKAKNAEMLEKIAALEAENEKIREELKEKIEEVEAKEALLKEQKEQVKLKREVKKAEKKSVDLDAAKRELDAVLAKLDSSKKAEKSTKKNSDEAEEAE